MRRVHGLVWLKLLTGLHLMDMVSKVQAQIATVAKKELFLLTVLRRHASASCMFDYRREGQRIFGSVFTCKILEVPRNSIRRQTIFYVT